MSDATFETCFREGCLVRRHRLLQAHKGTLRLDVDVAPPRLFLRVDGELDFFCAELLSTGAFAEAADIGIVHIDLGGLSFTDVAGVDALLALRAEHLAAGRGVEMVNAQPSVRRVFTLCGRGDVLPTTSWQSGAPVQATAGHQAASVLHRRLHRRTPGRRTRLSGFRAR